MKMPRSLSSPIAATQLSAPLRRRWQLLSSLRRAAFTLRGGAAALWRSAACSQKRAPWSAGRARQPASTDEQRSTPAPCARSRSRPPPQRRQGQHAAILRDCQLHRRHDWRRHQLATWAVKDLSAVASPPSTPPACSPPRRWVGPASRRATETRSLGHGDGDAAGPCLDRAVAG